MEPNVRVSVVMAIYDAEAYLGQAIESVLRQSFSNFELLLIHDCSPDGSLAIAKRYAELDSRIQLIDNDMNVGAAESRNIGLGLAKGEYIVIFDADDICFPERLQIQLAFLDEHPDIFLVGGSFLYINEKGKVIERVMSDLNSEQVHVLLLKQNVIHNPTVMFRNDKYRYRSKFVAGEDYDLWLRMLSDQRKMVVLPALTIKYRLQRRSITHTKQSTLAMCVKRARLFYAERMHSGKDSYLGWKPDIASGVMKHVSEAAVISREIKFSFKNDQDMSTIRNDIRHFWKRFGYGLWPASVIFFVSTYLPSALRKKFVSTVWRAH